MQSDENEPGLRDRALKRLQKKRAFASHVGMYIAVNALLIIIWATVADGGFFWPMFPMLGWGIGVFFQGLDLYRGEPTEDEIRREMNRLG